MVDGEPAYARESNHWGNFTTSDFVNGEYTSKEHNWEHPDAGQTKYTDKVRYAGYIHLKDLPNINDNR